MKRPVAKILVASAVVSAVVAAIGSMSNSVPDGPAHPIKANRVVLFTMPGITWSDITDQDASVPTLKRVTKEGATAALAPRTASVRPAAVRGYITLGAGNRGAAPNGSTSAERAYSLDENVADGVTASSYFAAETLGHPRDGPKGALVHLGVPEMQSKQQSLYHGTVVGALGEALARARIARGIVSAADHAREGVPPVSGRGSAVLSMVDADGVVPHGVIRGLVVPRRAAPFGVVTDERRVAMEAGKMLREVRVLMVEPGETLRADQFAPEAFPEAAAWQRRQALERTDRILSRLVSLLGPNDLLLVLAPSSSETSKQEHLTPVIAWGSGVEPGELVSATTHRSGIVTLTDVAPTVLSALGVDQPSSMSGRAIRQIDSGTSRPGVHEVLDKRSVFREGFVPPVFYSFVALFVVLSLLVALVFLFRVPLATPLIGVCYLILAVPLATFVLTVVPLWKVGGLPAHVTLWAVALMIAGAGWLVPGPRWTGAIPILLATAVFISVVLLFGGHLLVNAVFGNSVLAAGRFYGIPNTGSALYFGASVLALAGIGELWDVARRRWVIAGTLGIVLVLTGFPMFGADVGGLLTGFAAGTVIVLTTRGERVAGRRVVLALGAAVGVTLLVAFVDSLRAVDAQTHLGRFVDELFTNDGTALTTINRKASQSWASLSFSRFTYVIPVGIAALGVLLRRPQGAMRDVLTTNRLFRAGLAGLIVAGVLGFAVNDSGVAVPALLLGQAVPLVVLLALDHARARSGFELDG